jgi:hypothetical protein
MRDPDIEDRAIEDDEDGNQFVTKYYLRARLAELETRFLRRLMDMHADMQSVRYPGQDGLQRAFFGLYLLIIASVLINHFWR